MTYRTDVAAAFGRTFGEIRGLAVTGEEGE